jgi:beta-galactosidase
MFFQMKRFFSYQFEASDMRKEIILDEEWSFNIGDLPEGKGQSTDLEDDQWREVSIPHDWSIEGQFVERRPENWHAFQQLDHRIGYLPQGIGWYRKHLFIPVEYSGKTVVIQFDGVYRDSDVWINGVHLGHRPYGYISFYYDLSPHLKYGSDNVLAVRVDNTGVSSRWYTGSGIYRKVTLTVMEPVHIGQWGTYWTTPSITPTKATAKVQTTVLHGNNALQNSPVELLTEIFDGNAVVASQTSSLSLTSTSIVVSQELQVHSPKLWCPGSPHLYQIRSSLYQAGKIMDRYHTPLGLRWFRFDPNTGFWLNDQNLKMKGVCLHHDNGCLGAKEYRRAVERKLSLLQAMGCNAIRTSHNPPSQEMLELCDSMGFLVMNEAFDEWTLPKTPQGYTNHFNQWYKQDVTDFVHRDRNHPCVIMWSCGNEVGEQRVKDGVEVLKKLLDVFHAEDPTRPVTQGCNNMKEANEMGFAQLLDLAGYNYYGDRITGGANPKLFGTNFRCMYDDEHDRYPNRILIGTENCSSYNTRGVYHFPAEFGPSQQRHEDFHCSAFDVISEIPLLVLKTRPYVCGMFTWEGWDYIGEPTPYPWPARSSQYGIIDLAGFPKDTFYLYQTQWLDPKTHPLVHIVPHNWNWHPEQEISVWVYSNCESVELFLNGKSLGERRFDEEDFEDLLHLIWEVKFEPGELKAVAKTGGQSLATDILKTAGWPHHIAVNADRTVVTGKHDLVFLTVSICDAEGNIVPDASNLVKFTVEGPGEIIGTDNGNPISHEIFTDQQRHAFNGLCLGVLEVMKPSVPIRVKILSPHLNPAIITINPDK